ncbi:Ca(2+)-dependent cysteine protease [Tulasnella sp. 427]|nr:Ca(2+)-dependent cysteine protease [Tulasnella sp. 427]
MVRPARSNSFAPRIASAADEKATPKKWLFELFEYQVLIHNKFTDALLRRWDAFCSAVGSSQNILRRVTTGPKRKLLIISISNYVGPWMPLNGPKTDWKIWAMLGIMSGMDVEVLSDSLPTSDPSRNPTREIIERFARAHVKGNREGDEHVVVYSGHGYRQGLVLADGSYISQQELHDWFVRPLSTGALLWGLFDCCESSNPFGLGHKAVTYEGEGIPCEPLKTRSRGEVKGTVISIGSAAGNSSDINLNDPDVSTPANQPTVAGALAWAAYRFFYALRKEDKPYVAAFVRCLASKAGQEGQVTMSAIIRDPILPMLRPPPQNISSI